MYGVKKTVGKALKGMAQSQLDSSVGLNKGYIGTAPLTKRNDYDPEKAALQNSLSLSRKAAALGVDTAYGFKRKK